MILHITKPKIALRDIRLEDIALIMFFSLPTFNLVFSAIFSQLSINGDAIIRIVLWILAIFSIVTNYGNNKKDVIFVYIAVVLIFALSALINSDLLPWMNDENWGVFNRIFRIDRGIFALFFVRLVGDRIRIKRDLRVCMYLLLVYIYYMALKRIGLGYWELLNNDGISTSHSLANMAFGYLCVFNAILFFTFKDSNKQILEIILGVISSILGITLGSRGTIIVIGSYIILSLVHHLQSEYSIKKLLLVIVIAIILVVVYLYYNKIMIGLQLILSNLGIESRNIAALFSGTITDSNGRDRIAELSMEGIRHSFPLGNGAYGDRPYVGQYVRWGYSHNIFLEIVCSFGLLGILFLLWFGWSSVKILTTKENNEWREIFMIFFCSSLKLLVSDSFWFLSYFWACIAVIISMKKDCSHVKYYN